MILASWTEVGNAAIAAFAGLAGVIAGALIARSSARQQIAQTFELKVLEMLAAAYAHGRASAEAYRASAPPGAIASWASDRELYASQAAIRLDEAAALSAGALHRAFTDAATAMRRVAASGQHDAVTTDLDALDTALQRVQEQLAQRPRP